MRFPSLPRSSLKELVDSLQPFYVDKAERDRDEALRSDFMGIVDGSWLTEQVNYFNGFFFGSGRQVLRESKEQSG